MLRGLFSLNLAVYSFHLCRRTNDRDLIVTAALLALPTAVGTFLRLRGAWLHHFGSLSRTMPGLGVCILCILCVQAF